MSQPLIAKYKNQSYPGYSYGFLGDDINKYLTALSAGVDDTIGSGLKSIPTSELLGRLKPMIRERDFVFSLTFYSQPLLKNISNLASKWSAVVPRQSAAYIIGTPYALGGNDHAETKAAGGNPLQRWKDALKREIANARAELDKIVSGAYFRSLNGIEIITKDALQSAYESLDDAEKAVTECRTPKGLNYRYPKFLEWVDNWVPSGEVAPSPAFGFNWTQVWNKAVTSIYRIIGKVLSEHPYDENGVANTVNKVAATLQEPDVKNEAIDVIVAFVGDYVEALKKYLEDLGSSGTTVDTTVVIRLYPRAAFISHASPQLLTTKLSENSFLQTAVRPDNIMISMQDCLAFDTLDTQWAQLYREIFSTIISCGNPSCEVRLGRRTIPSCYLFATPQIPDTLGTLSTFAVQFICTENNDIKIGGIESD